MAAIEDVVVDVVVFLNYLQKCHQDISQGASVAFWLKFSVQVTSSRAHLLQRRVLVTA